MHLGRFQLVAEREIVAVEERGILPGSTSINELLDLKGLVCRFVILLNSFRKIVVLLMYRSLALLG
jgi:hypothetical protein